MSRPVTKLPDEIKVSFKWTRAQEEIFHNCKAKYVVVSAGRRCGKTAGAAQFLIETCLKEKNRRILWCDVVYSQIQSYVETYFFPLLRQLPDKCWSYHSTQKTLTIGSNKVIFRSADVPDKIVGSGYWMAILNEAGIQLHDNPRIWTQIIAPMLLDFPDSRAFFIGTPRGIIGKDGKDAFYYTLYKKGLSTSKEYDPRYASYKYSSYDNPFLKKKDIEELETETPPVLRAQELQGDFVNFSDTIIFRQEWFNITCVLPPIQDHFRRFITLDTAYSTKTTADESACTTWIKTLDGQFFAIDCWHERLDFPQLLAKVKYTIDSKKADYIIIEKKASGLSLIQQLRKDLAENMINVIEFDPTPYGDKIQRATSITPYLERGMLNLYQGLWVPEFIGQHITFPGGTHDDIVDTVSMAFLWARMDTHQSASNIFFTHALPPAAQEAQFFKRFTQGYGQTIRARLEGF